MKYDVFPLMFAYATKECTSDAIKDEFDHQINFLQKVRSIDIVVLAGDLYAQVECLGAEELFRWLMGTCCLQIGSVTTGVVVYSTTAPFEVSIWILTMPSFEFILRFSDQQTYRLKRIIVSKLATASVATIYT